jgi:PIN domain nuclease of toxin-antitoxin system
MSVVLLDTIALDFLVFRLNELPPKATTAIERADQVLVSQVSLWEMSNHVREGQIKLNDPFAVFWKKALTTFGLTLLDLQWPALAYMASFAYHIIEKPFKRPDGSSGVKKELHKDTFDRLMIAHAISMNVPIISSDQFFPHYKPLGLQVIWK